MREDLAAGSLSESYKAVDWDATTLGPVDGWSSTLLMAVSTALQTRFPVTLLWGPEHVLVYNEAYVPLIGDKHPAALGRPAREVFPEIWDTIGPMLDSVSAGSGAVWFSDLRLLMDRWGFLEECYFTFSYSAVTNDSGGIEGVIDIASETTEQVLGNRRLRLLHQLTEVLSTAAEPDELAERALPVLRAASDDFTAVDLHVTEVPDTEADTGAGVVREPLPGTGRVLVVRPSPHLPVDDAYLRFVRLVAGTLTQAFDRVRIWQAEQRLVRMEREMSETLQRSLLTPPARTEHLSVAVRYHSAVEQSQIGGDWYDSFVLSDGPLTLVVGDVTGHDRHAAAAMAQLRNVLRGIAVTVRSPPSRILTGLDHAMGSLGVDAMATAVIAQIEDGRTLRWSNAGHPPPALLRPDGSAELLAGPPARLLGVRQPPERDDHTADLEPGSTVVFYTDGLIERRATGLDDSLQRLTESLAGRQHLDAEQVCDHLLATFSADADDDIVLLVVRLTDR
ncbi:PP2C family protein-serine/threonine phosphatase [Actinoplanes derwentensis]|uniref:Stage II sporulation protein E (SpoIIE) n=1 Tax=Actinoplanes derwentensis TaxID=113562 RepID=A0A1H1SIQ4_9ACTN|nr:PP2C family protein-serine/threonine phosphatase [Actinoplanes derwentensis]GID83305.1 hypothetical protein Ade03nite_22290 [Actinoplanes derwentensis]SDS47239.1 Stage II sporulation protein E (SpoIIE) [Actinoplanes derwentensis]